MIKHSINISSKFFYNQHQIRTFAKSTKEISIMNLYSPTSPIDNFEFILYISHELEDCEKKGISYVNSYCKDKLCNLKDIEDAMHYAIEIYRKMYLSQDKNKALSFTYKRHWNEFVRYAQQKMTDDEKQHFKQTLEIDIEPIE